MALTMLNDCLVSAGPSFLTMDSTADIDRLLQDDGCEFGTSSESSSSAAAAQQEDEDTCEFGIEACKATFATDVSTEGPSRVSFLVVASPFPYPPLMILVTLMMPLTLDCVENDLAEGDVTWLATKVPRDLSGPILYHTLRALPLTRA